MTIREQGQDVAPSQSPDTAQTPSDRSTTFRAVTSEPEHYSGEKLLVGAYAIVWAIVFLWMAGVWKKQRSMAQRLSALETEIARAAAARSQGDGSRGAP